MKEPVQYTGIIKTMPADWLKDTPGGVDRWMKRVLVMNKTDEIVWRFNLPGKPKYEVLYFYLLMKGVIRFRANILGYDGEETIKCYDGSTHSGKCWVNIGPPVVPPPRIVTMKGFQGFRYTDNLW